MSAGATDSVYTRPLGIPSYGIDGMFDDLTMGERMVRTSALAWSRSPTNWNLLPIHASDRGCSLGVARTEKQSGRLVDCLTPCAAVGALDS
jgi:hypothetical protein